MPSEVSASALTWTFPGGRDVRPAVTNGGRSPGLSARAGGGRRASLGQTLATHPGDRYAELSGRTGLSRHQSRIRSSSAKTGTECRLLPGGARAARAVALHPAASRAASSAAVRPLTCPAPLRDSTLLTIALPSTESRRWCVRGALSSPDRMPPCV